MNTQRSIAIQLTLFVIIAVGCQRKDPAPLQVAPHVDDAAATPTDASMQPEINDPDYWEKVTALYESAKDSGETGAANASEWIAELYQSATSSGQTVALDTSHWVNEMYQQAKDAGETSASSAKEWLIEDVRQIGSWKYKTIQMRAGEESDIEVRLNAMGAERWECFWVDRQQETVTFYFKKAGRSYLRHLPTKELIRMLPLFGGDDS